MVQNQMVPDKIWQKIKNGQKLNSRPVTLLEQTESTNTIALKMAGSGAPSGALVIAETQSNGRGRLGKSWLSPAGSGLYFSMILRPALVFKEIPRLTLAAGVAVCRTISQKYGIGPLLKWPNDILLNNRKCGGILAEAEVAGSEYLVVLGIGLNISTPQDFFPASLRDRATSLQHHVNRPVVRGELLADLVNKIEQVVLQLEQGEFSTILEQWRQLDATRGKLLTWVSVAGKVVEGISLGPDEQGRLHIRDNRNKVHEILSGDVLLVNG